jgi:AmmeMemoRadiSam system protein B
MFYPNDPVELKETIEEFLRTAKPVISSVPKALIAPHAGYIYSGAIAASAFVHLVPAKKTIRRVILAGPSHRYPFRGIAVSRADAFRSPLGEVPLDQAAIDSIVSLPPVCISDAAHAEEHSLEVQLPFLQTILESFRLVPLSVGGVKDTDVADVLDRLWGGPETCVVVSSDLTHYVGYEEGRKIDRQTTDSIEALDPDGVAHDHACGALAIRGLLQVARQRKLKVRTVDLRNSGDTAGSRDRVVGYGAYLFLEE